MMDRDTAAKYDLLAWAAGTGSVPRDLRELAHQALADVDLGDRPSYAAFQVGCVVLGRIRQQVIEQVPEASSDELREALQGPWWTSVPEEHVHLVDQIRRSASDALSGLIPAHLDDILAEYDVQARQEAERMAEVKRQERVRNAIESAAEDIRHRLDAVAGFERGTRMAAGTLAAAVKADPAGKDRPVDMTRLAYLTGFTRQTLYKYAEEADNEHGRDVTKVSNATLAKWHLGYGVGCHEEVDAEVWKRWPNLAGWYRAARWLQEQSEEAWWASRGGYSPFAEEHPPRDKAAQALMREYKDTIEMFAEGPLGEQP